MYSKAVSMVCNFYQLPYKIILSITSNLDAKRNYFSNKITSIRLIKPLLKKNGVYLKLQIKNSRATYISTISDVISDNDFIVSCEKISLIEIGYFSKIEEQKRIQNLSNNTIYKISIFKCVLKKLQLRKSISKNIINPDEFQYNFIDTQLGDNSQLCIQLLIVSSKHIFQVPYDDFILDSSLLDGMYPPDLLKIGYEICVRDIQEDRPPTFGF